MVPFPKYFRRHVLIQTILMLLRALITAGLQIRAMVMQPVNTDTCQIRICAPDFDILQTVVVLH